MAFTQQDRTDFLNELEKASQNLSSNQAEFYHAVLHQLILIATESTIDQLIEAVNRAKNVTEL
ncbi:hypothetical protein J0X19_22960 [Hymenobacter sp. BT186]|uniref:Uncharacterized protein n=1 Tax=Hymenobacter telluris TaxID=2816474 RepID=A0A939JFB3_9BACT|nr:hypothetical protein [Hymenobacter telluris]MBO0360838.1 hypothetical protein [Hymenobacter telluris]MBW3376867.1 hypothetical protein [Hymenobacter norwichensis]